MHGKRRENAHAPAGRSPNASLIRAKVARLARLAGRVVPRHRKAAAGTGATDGVRRPSLRRALAALKRLRIWQKLAVMGLTFIIGLTVATSLLLAEKQRALTSTEREREGIEYLLPLKTLLSEVSVHKILQHRLLREDAGVE